MQLISCLALVQLLNNPLPSGATQGRRLISLTHNFYSRTLKVWCMGKLSETCEAHQSKSNIGAMQGHFPWWTIYQNVPDTEETNKAEWKCCWIYKWSVQILTVLLWLLRPILHEAMARHSGVLSHNTHPKGSNLVSAESPCHLTGMQLWSCSA